MFPVIPVIVLGVASAIGLRDHIIKNKVNRSLVKNLTTWLESLGLPENTPVDARLPNGNTLLIEATRLQLDNIIAGLLSKGATVNSMNDEGKTALFYASSKSAVKALIDAGALVDARDIHGRTALFYVKKPDALSCLIAMGAESNLVDEQGNNVLYSFRNDDEHSDDILHCVRILLTLAPSLKTEKCTCNRNLNRIIKNATKLRNGELINAVKTGDVKKIELILKENDALCKIDYKSLFYIAIDNRQPATISLLYKYCDYPSVSLSKVRDLMRDIKGSKEPAERQRFLACLKLLLDIGAHFNLNQYYDKAVQLNDPDLIKLLSQYVKGRGEPKLSTKSRALMIEKYARSTAPCDQLSNDYSSKSMKRRWH